MLDAIRETVGNIPGALLAFAAPLLVWARALSLGPRRTYRHGLSGWLALLCGALMFACMLCDIRLLPLLLTAALVVMTAMFVALWWPPAEKAHRRSHD